jgi:hypothetical protein
MGNSIAKVLCHVSGNKIESSAHFRSNGNRDAADRGGAKMGTNSRNVRREYQTGEIKRFPPRWDLRETSCKKYPPVTDQLAEGSCVAHAYCACLSCTVKAPETEAILRRVRNIDILLARGITTTTPKSLYAFIDDNKDEINSMDISIDPQTKEIEGTSFQAVHQQASAKSDLTGGVVSLFDLVEIDRQVDSIKVELLFGRPVMIGISTDETFNFWQDDPVKTNFVIPEPSFSLERRKGGIGHALTIIGWEDGETCFLVRNSWGKDWGIQGHCFLDYSSLSVPNFILDAYVLTPK